MEKKGEIHKSTFKSWLFLFKKERPVEQITVAIDNRNGDGVSLLLLTNFIHCLYDLVQRGEGKGPVLSLIDQQCSWKVTSRCLNGFISKLGGSLLPKKLVACGINNLQSTALFV